MDFTIEPSRKGTRSRLLEAASGLFHSRGFGNTSLAAVSERAQANPGSLYYFFKSKEDLLEAVLERYSEILDSAVLEPAFARTTDPVERIFAVLGTYRGLLLDSDFAVGCPIGNLALELNDTRPEVRKRIAGNFDKWTDAIEGCLRAAFESLPAGLDWRRLSRFILTVMEGAVLQARGHRSIAPFDDSIEHLRDYLGRLQRTAKEQEEE